jgi:hypothetical protein
MTTVPPPPAQPGHVPVYDHDSDSWRLVSIEEFRKLVQPNA